MPGQCPETIHGAWGLKLAEAERRYLENRTGENVAEFGRVLAIFAALVMRGVIPSEPPR